MLPQNTAFGKLEIFEIYEFFNMPVLFACRNRAGHTYLAVWIDETEENNIWLYVALSERRFQQLRLAKFDLHDAFTQAEDEVAFQVTVKKMSNTAKIKVVPASTLPQEWTPLPGNYLDIPGSLPSIVWENVDQRDLQGARLQPSP